jgi:hypothetical protein
MLNSQLDFIRHRTFSSAHVKALASFFLCVLLFTPAEATQSDINGPSGSGAFGTQVVVLPNGNIAVTDPNYSEGGQTTIGAVYL